MEDNTWHTSNRIRLAVKEKIKPPKGFKVSIYVQMSLYRGIVSPLKEDTTDIVKEAIRDHLKWNEFDLRVHWPLNQD